MKRKVTSVLLALALLVSCFSVYSLKVSAATNLSVEAQVSPSADYQVFYLSGCDENTYYDLFDGTTFTEGIKAENGTLKLDPDIYYNIYLYNDEDEVSASSLLAHKCLVTYKLVGENGTDVMTEYAPDAYYGQVYSFVADDVKVHGGMEYYLEGFAEKEVSYGVDQLVFTYNVYDPDPKFLYIDYVDNRGNLLKSEQHEVLYYGGEQTFTVAQTLNIDGRIYNKVRGADSITVGYFSPVLDYEITFLEEITTVEYPYTVKVNFKDTNGIVLGYDYKTVTEEMSQQATFNVNVPGELGIRKDGSVYYYNPAATSVSIPTDGTVRTYDVTYTLFDTLSPYVWTVNCVDAASNKILNSTSITVNVDETVTYDAMPRLTLDGKNYQLDSSMGGTYERNYSDNSSRVFNLYYNEEGVVVDSERTMTVNMICVSDESVLNTVSITIAAGDTGSVELPASIKLGGKEYVKLAGQGDEMEISYYSRQRTFYAYYRDVNDLQNVDVYVTEVERENGETDIVLNDPNSGEATDIGTETGTLTDPEDIGENDVPLNPGEADPTTPPTENIGENETPKAGGNSSMLMGGIVIAIIVLAAVAVLFVMTSKKKKAQ